MAGVIDNSQVFNNKSVSIYNESWKRVINESRYKKKKKSGKI